MPLETNNLSGGYDSKPIVQEISIALQAGEWLSLVGANGSGKSTLLKLMSRLLKPQTGAVLLDGKVIHTQKATAVAQKLALLPQQQTIPAGLSVRQLVSLGRTPHQPWWQWELDAEDRDKVEKALELTRMKSLCDRPVEQLSGGERQRAFLALALAQDPQVLLLDEPTTYLDIRYQLQLLELLKQLNKEQKLSIITVLHDVNLAARYSSRIALLSQGKIWAVGEPRIVLTPEHLADVLGIEVAVLETPVGLQICSLAAIDEEYEAASNNE
ncbi:MAG: ATP-binding cassette domain-containing protein [Brasilonema octagenarum HA4186-MV1]|jgi:iron complex transport system ATP-binding protein|uniref:ABC transporter ATP-binding protein n=1 Tax=Brasilonema sennae CENA114 TaxID=415709 RepID=A0A856MNS5_9CYAN|nr:ABC transporter ATP-binding protein [Brasilonema sennae]MBW4629278.1 ATP-binding cassette domain-containing protein [Brasilonema octagenarum HA4186-MV1]QDL11740.1 ABC transporter ATP-binding protein [Brasilonema sennae CENA114]QDL18121.1 ABC transporter ATP-binding protein [Brasilonema octagenarum UFV-E1]